MTYPPSSTRQDSFVPSGSQAERVFDQPFWYLSFVDKRDVFLGSAVVKGNDCEEALTNSWKVGANPGGEVAITGPIRPLPFGVAVNRFVPLAEMVDTGDLAIEDLGPNTLQAYRQEQVATVRRPVRQTRFARLRRRLRR